MNICFRSVTKETRDERNQSQNQIKSGIDLHSGGILVVDCGRLPNGFGLLALADDMWQSGQRWLLLSPVL